MEIAPKDLIAAGYQLKDELKHDDLIPFVQKSLRLKTTMSRVNYFASGISLLLLVAWFVFDTAMGTGRFGKSIAHIGYGIALLFLLIPIHEYIHVLAYRYVGAKNTSYYVNWKQFYFAAVADHFVANEKEFRIVGLAPFLIITSIGLLLLLVVSSYWMYTILAMLLAHTAACSGDFALLSYFEANKDKGLVTYDDQANKISYFYEKQ